MQYAYEEAVRELSDFIGKNTTADNFWKMEQVLLTVLRGDDKYYQSIYEEGQDQESRSASTPASYPLVYPSS